MTKSTVLRLLPLAILTLGFSAGNALAHEPAPGDQKTAASDAKMDHSKMDHGKMDHGSMGNMDNMHMMPAVVDAVDRSSGMVDVTSDGMKLKLHFPPASLASVKVGDKITVHLG